MTLSSEKEKESNHNLQEEKRSFSNRQLPGIEFKSPELPVTQRCVGNAQILANRFKVSIHEQSSYLSLLC